MIKEDNRTTEQTFAFNIVVGDLFGNIQRATLQPRVSPGQPTTPFDYVLSSPGARSIQLEFLPDQSERTFPFSLQPDNLAEGTEAFRATISSVYLGGLFPPFQLSSPQYPGQILPAFGETLIRILDDDCK